MDQMVVSENQPRTSLVVAVGFQWQLQVSVASAAVQEEVHMDRKSPCRSVVVVAACVVSNHAH